MITDQQTNSVYFSSLIKSKFPSLWNEIEAVLKERSIGYSFMENTRNIWCRDYMPIQIDEKNLIEFQYFPDYYLTPTQVKHLTIQDEMEYKLKLSVKKIPLIVDGGNIVKSGAKVIMTDKVFTENENHSKEVILKMLKKILKVDEIYIIPRQPYDWSGHADGMVRFYDDDTLLVNDFRQESPSWRKLFTAAIIKTGLEIIEFPYVHSERRTDDGEYTAHGCYINYALIGKTILFPRFGQGFGNYDALALKRVIELYGREYHIHTIEADSLAWEGGVLNCCTWNMHKPVIGDAIEKILPVCRFFDRLLVILSEDFNQSLPLDTVCVKIHLDERMHHEPWSLAKHLKHGEVFQPIESSKEIAQARQRIGELFSLTEITEIYDELKNPSLKAVESLISVPERLNSYS